MDGFGFGIIILVQSILGKFILKVKLQVFQKVF